jgi:hypothetical protein
MKNQKHITSFVYGLKLFNLEGLVFSSGLFRPEIGYDNFAAYFDKITIYYNVWLKKSYF